MHLAPVPQSWVEALKLVQLEFPHAMIYGGALRDLVCGVEPNDIDIAIPYFGGRSDLFHDRIARLCKLFKQPDAPFKSEEKIKEYLENMAGAVGAVLELPNWLPPAHLVRDYGSGWRGFNGRALDIQLTALTCEIEDFSEELVLGRCDFGCSRIGFNGLELTITPEFLHDWGYKEFTVRNPYNVEATYKRWHRISGRYGGWVYVNPHYKLGGSEVESIAREALFDFDLD